MDLMDLDVFCSKRAVKLMHSLTANARNQGICSHDIDLVIYDILVSAPEGETLPVPVSNPKGNGQMYYMSNWWG